MPIFDDIFFSFTFGGEALSLAASLATVTFMKEQKALELISARGDVLLREEKSTIDRYGLGSAMAIEGYPARSLVAFKRDQWHRSADAQNIISTGNVAARGFVQRKPKPLLFPFG